MISVLDRCPLNENTKDYTATVQSILEELKGIGGTINFPAGEYEVGSLRIYDNTTIHLEAGAVLKASADKNLYPVITEELIPGFVRGTRRGILFALNAKNITINGEGTIDGCGYNWWHKGESDEVRPRTVQFLNVDGVTIEGIKIINSPCWTINPIACNNVTIHNVSVLNPYDSPNTDGINPESCKNVKISDCYIDVGDDCIAIKSGLERDLYQKEFACENIVISNCTFVHGHGGVVLGSEMSGGVRNVLVTNCVFQNTDRGIRVKTRRGRGGSIEDVSINNVIMDNVFAGFTINEYYFCGADITDKEIFGLDAKPVNDMTPYIRNIALANVNMKNVLGAGVYFIGLPELPISDIRISNISMNVIGSQEGIDSVMAPNVDKSYGEGIHLKNVNNVSINGCLIKAKTDEIFLDNAEDTYINGKKA